MGGFVLIIVLFTLLLGYLIAEPREGRKDTAKQEEQNRKEPEQSPGKLTERLVADSHQQAETQLKPVSGSKDGQGVLMPDGSPLPETLIGDTVWVTHEGYEPLELPSPDARKTRPKPSIQFMEPCRYVASYQKGDTTYRLVVREGHRAGTVATYLGWADEDHLLTMPRAWVSARWGTHLKAILVNTLEFESLRKPGVEVVVRMGPTSSAPVRRTLPFFSFYFVYSDTGGADGFVLLGTAPSFRPFGDTEEVRQVVLGWAPRRAVQFWDTRVGINWDRTTTQPSRPFAARRTWASLSDGRKMPFGQYGARRSSLLFEESRDETVPARKLLMNSQCPLSDGKTGHSHG